MRNMTHGPIMRLCAATLCGGMLMLGVQVTPATAMGLSGTNYIPEGTLTIDNDFSDWDSSWQVINESDETDVTYSYDCGNPSTDTWTTVENPEECTSGYLYNELGQLDLQTGYFGINETNMFVGFESAAAMMSVYDVAAEEYISVFMLPHTETPMTALPRAFDHEMVFAFGPADEEIFTYYMVAEMFVPQDLNTESMEGVTLNIYQDSGDAVGFDSDDILIGALDTSNSDDSESEQEQSLSTAFEVKQNIEDFLALTEMDPTSSYGFRIETHSDEGDVTDRVVVDFASNAVAPEEAPSNVRINAVKKRSAKVRWDAVDGATHYKVRLSKKNGDRIHTFKNVQNLYKVINKAHLKKGRIYHAQVAACNDTGCSEWSEEITFTTNE